MADVKQSNPKAFEQLDIKLKDLEGFETRVGWHEGDNYPDGTPLAYVAAIQELGWGPIPPRPFMRPAARKNETKWKDVAGFGANKVLAGQWTGRQAMDALGEIAKEDIASSIAAVNAPPLSEITLVARKWRREGKKITGATIGEIAQRLASGENIDVSGVSTKPLQDTGLLLAKVRYVTVSSK